MRLLSDWHGNSRDHLASGDVQLIIVGKLQLVESYSYQSTDLHIEGLLFPRLRAFELHG